MRLASRVQYAMLGLQLVALLAFGVAALVRDGAATPSPAFFNPLGFDGFGSLAEAVLLCLCIYWGWGALITFNEETAVSGRTPGRAALIATVVLLVAYLFTAFAAISFAGTGSTGLGLGNAVVAGDVFTGLGPAVLGDALAKVVQLAIGVSVVGALLTSAAAAPRTALSMPAHGALPGAFARIHPRHHTPPSARCSSAVRRPSSSSC